MPTYEYVCEKCGHQFELFQSMSESPLTACPKEHCQLRRWGKGKVRRVIGAGAGLIFKGSGFYTTDYRSDQYKQAAKNESTSKAAEPKSADSKPADSKSGGAAAKPAAATPKSQGPSAGKSGTTAS